VQSIANAFGNAECNQLQNAMPSRGRRILLQVGVPSAHGWSCGAYVLIDGTIALIAAFTAAPSQPQLVANRGHRRQGRSVLI